MTGDEIEVYKRKIFIYTHHALIQAHCPHADKSFGSPDIRSRQSDVMFRHTTNNSCLANCSCKNSLPVCFKTFGMIAYKVKIYGPIFQKRPAYRMMQGNIGTRVQLQVYICQRTGLCFSRIADNDFQTRIFFFSAFHSSP